MRPTFGELGAPAGARTCVLCDVNGIRHLEPGDDATALDEIQGALAGAQVVHGYVSLQPNPPQGRTVALQFGSADGALLDAQALGLGSLAAGDPRVSGLAVVQLGSGSQGWIERVRLPCGRASWHLVRPPTEREVRAFVAQCEARLAGGRR